MKRFILMAVAATMTIGTIQAQSDEPRHEVAVSIGAWSNSDIIDGFEKLGSAMVGVKTKNSEFTGPISAEYFYHFKPWLGVGGIAVYGQSTEDFYFPGSGSKDGEFRNTYVTLMPGVKFDYLRKKHFGMYSKLAFGATLRTEKTDYSASGGKDDSDTEVHVNWQVSLLGIEAGGIHMRGFAELGTGEQGIFVVGARYRF